MTKISLYNMLAISKLAYVGSFAIPNSAALNAQHRALQLLSRGPWNSLHPTLLKNIKCLGMPSQAIDLSSLPLASRVRIAQCTSANVMDCRQELENVYKSNEIVHQFLDKKFINQSCIETVCTGLEFFMSRFAVDDMNHFSQKTAYKMICDGLNDFSSEQYLTRKLQMRLDETVSSPIINSIIMNYRASSRKFGYAVTFSHVRAICNHWCTRSRFGSKSAGCCFSCGHHTDRIAHTLVCPKFWQLFFSLTNFDYQPLDLHDVLLLTHHKEHCDSALCNVLLIGTHLCFLAYHSCKSGQTLSPRLVQHLLSHYCRSHCNVAKFLANSFPSPSSEQHPST